MHVTVVHGVAVTSRQEHRDDLVFLFKGRQHDARAMTGLYSFSVRYPVAFVEAQGRNTHGKTVEVLLKFLVERHLKRSGYDKRNENGIVRHVLKNRTKRLPC
jgi:hypothetical protein